MRDRGQNALRGQRAFTIIEMAVVLAVASVIAGVVIPDFIEMARADLGEQAAVRMATVASGARQFFHNEGLTSRGAGPILSARPAFARWPGEAIEIDDNPSVCAVGAITAEQELVGGDFVDSETMLNPWGAPILTGIHGGGGGGGWWGGGAAGEMKCRFLIATDVPNSVRAVVESYMPGSTCSNQQLASRCPVGGGNPAAGFVRCCVGVPRPSVEASLEVLLMHAFCANPANSGHVQFPFFCRP